MGTLVAKAYRTTLLAKAADHTYVTSGPGGKAWGCWGGKQGGRVLREAEGSTKRADMIAKPDERAGIKCYLVNGVCHQSANRILLPASVTVSTAHGYWISEALFGTYGRVGQWPCKAPFHQYAAVGGDLIQRASRRSLAARRKVARKLTAAQERERRYLQEVQELYGGAARAIRGRFFSLGDAREFHQALFMHMAEFRLGSMLGRRLAAALRGVHGKTAKARAELESGLAARDMSMDEYVDRFNRQTIEFQEALADLMTPRQYKSLFKLAPGRSVVLADPSILKKVHRK